MNYIPQPPQKAMQQKYGAGQNPASQSSSVGQNQNPLANGTPNMSPQQFPPNLADQIPPDVQKKIMIWLLQKYLWPQIMERYPFEKMWDKLLEMSRVTIPNDELFSNSSQAASRTTQEATSSNRDKARVSDSVIHDAIERLVDITAFIAFRDGIPCYYERPEYIDTPMETNVYTPTDDKIRAGNALLSWNSANCSLKRHSIITYRHHYTYGVSYVISDYKFRVKLINRQDNQGQIVPVPEITELGTTFQPISLRKLWLNWRLPAYDMEAQPCPFFFEECPRFALMENAYDPVNNPFGYLNLDQAFNDQYIYTGPEMKATRDALAITQTSASNSNEGFAIAQIIEPKHSVEAKWFMMPMMPFDPQTGDFKTYAKDNSPVPYKRFVIETFGPNITSGAQVLLRLQENFYPSDRLPLYASVHMPDLDSGQYAPSIGQLLYNHYKEITLCMEQYLLNKDLLNDPPVWVTASCPALNENFNKKGGKVTVNGPNDFGWRQVPDATSSMVEMMRYLHEAAQTTSKATEAILGQAMGSRTSATEASNAFQSSMSAITTDVDLLTEDLHGGYAMRVWDYTGMWFDPDLLKHITGQFGFILKPEDMWSKMGIKTDVGSSYVGSIVKQNNLRFILQSSANDPTINHAVLWTMLLEEMGFEPKKLVDDQGTQQQIQFANLQTCKTFLGEPVIVDPDQNHQIAIDVKTAYLKDVDSMWMTKFPQMAPLLIQQIQQHQMFLKVQQHFAMLQGQMQMAQAQMGINHEQNPHSQSLSVPPRPSPAPLPPPPQQTSGPGGGQMK